MTDLENLRKNLLCPITMDLLEDPIIVICCKKAFGRMALAQWMKLDKTCPLCKGDLTDFDPLSAPRDLMLAGLIDSIKAISQEIKPEIEVQPVMEQWSCKLKKFDESIGIGQLEIAVCNAKFIPKPMLFIPVVDRSGSMSGNPWRQVETALIHIMALSSQSKFIRTKIVAYDSVAAIIPMKDDPIDQNRVIKSMFTGGGTNFIVAFDKIGELLKSYVCDDSNNINNVSGVTIAFLTDGESGADRLKLIDYFKTILATNWTGPCSIHSIGFGANCDRELLEGLWKTGNIGGTFRYAEPSDNGDTLCNKLTNLFEIVSKTSTMQADLILDKCQLMTASKVLFPIDDKGNGIYHAWIQYNKNLGQLTVTSTNVVTIDISYIETSDTEKSKLFSQWKSIQIDRLASDIMTVCTTKADLTSSDYDFALALINQRLRAIKLTLNGDIDLLSIQRLVTIEAELNSIIKGCNVNLGKLGDLRFGSHYIGTTISISEPKIKLPKSEVIVKKSGERIIKYTRGYGKANRSVIAETINSAKSDYMDSKLVDLLSNASVEDLLKIDSDGNNAIMIAAYTGHSSFLKTACDKFKNLDLDIKNLDNETALTLAIKKNGFWRSVEILLKANCCIPSDRISDLITFCIDHRFIKTADLLSKVTPNLNTNFISVDNTVQSIMYYYENQIASGNKFDLIKLTEIAIKKAIGPLLISLINRGTKITTDHIFSLVQRSNTHFEIFCQLKQYINFDPNLLDSNGDSLLFKACEIGAKDIVEFLLDSNVNINLPNAIGNTSLWIACCNRHIDIIKILLLKGADVNICNQKGNPAFVPVCQRGNIEIAQLLIENGADINIKNNNGDTLILLCCRNGQAEVLKLLLNYVDPEIVNFAAHIDGFMPIMAATEANKPSCIKVLYEYGIDLNTKTTKDNIILAGATPLHLAAYYNLVEAAQTLLDLGADINSVDCFNYNALHIAIIQDNVKLATLLYQRGINISQVDQLGNIPIVYCRGGDSNEIFRILIDPVYDNLIKLASSNADQTTMNKTCNIIRLYVGAPGILSKSQAIDIVGRSGRTPLMEAIIYSNYTLTALLIELGADPTKKNMQGLNAIFWAELVKNVRIKKILPKILDNETDQLKKIIEKSGVFCLFKPVILNIFSMEISIYAKMNNFVNNVNNVNNVNDIGIKILQLDNVSNKDLTSIIKYHHAFFIDPKEADYFLWISKIASIGSAVSINYSLNSTEIMAIYFYSYKISISEKINKSLIENDFQVIGPYISYLVRALNKLPNFTGEVFRGCANINRKLFTIGSIISWPTFVTTTNIWKIAVESCPDFTTKKKMGTIFAIKSKTGKNISQFSHSPQDCEVIFMPNTKFTVTNWYIGDIIALGQSNIRGSTFKIKNDDLEKMIESSSNLIIEMVEN